MQGARCAGDFGRLITDALKIRDDLDRSHHGTQIIRGGLTFDDQMTAGVIQLHFQLVDFFISRDDALGFLDIQRTKTNHRIMELFFHETTHLQYPRADRLKVKLVLSGRVFVWHGGLRDINRNGR